MSPRGNNTRKIDTAKCVAHTCFRLITIERSCIAGIALTFNRTRVTLALIREEGKRKRKRIRETNFWTSFIEAVVETKGTRTICRNGNWSLSYETILLNSSSYGATHFLGNRVSGVHRFWLKCLILVIRGYDHIVRHTNRLWYNVRTRRKKFSIIFVQIFCRFGKKERRKEREWERRRGVKKRKSELFERSRIGKSFSSVRYSG